MSRTEATGAPQPAFAAGEAYQLLVEGIVDCALYLLDPTGLVATWNPGAARIKGYEASEVIGRSFAMFFPPEDRASGKPARALATALAEGRFEDESYRMRKDGSRFWANVVLTVLRDDQGVVRGYAKITRDLTQRKLAEEAARQANERFHRLVDSVTDYAVFLLDPAGHVETWNEGAHRAKGYEEHEIVGRHFSAFYTEEDRQAGRPAAILGAVRAHGRFEDEGWRVRKDGSRFWANVILTALRDDAGEIVGFAKVTRDLTARREAEQVHRNLLVAEAARAAAEAMAARAQETNRVKDEFLATVSHELRTPLNAIVGWAQLLRQEPLEGTVAHAVEVIDRNAKAQVRIVEDILDVSRIISGKLRIDPQPTDLSSIARDALEVVRPAAAAKRIALSFTTETGRTELVGDRERLQQVVWNLLSNAVKFTDRGGEVSVLISKADDELTLAVRDNGRGMDAELLPLAFDRFYQADASITRRVGGLGLGLALVRHIVELHGGTVVAESAGLGKGATFRIMLPVHAAGGEASVRVPHEGLPQAAPRRANARMLAGARIVVVEDQPDARELLVLVLGHAGAIVREAGTAAEGLTAVLEHEADLLVSDLGLPGEDGYSLIRKLRSRGPAGFGTIPALALSAYTRAEDKLAAARAGFTEHLGKPIDPAVIVSTVAALLRRRKVAP